MKAMFIAAVAPFVMAATVSAQIAPERRAQDAVEVMAGKQKADDVFAPVFLAEVDQAKISALAGQLQAENGPILGMADLVAESATTIRFTIRFRNAKAPAWLTIEGATPNKVSGFWIGPVVPMDDSMAKIAADFAALPGRAGFTVTRLGDDAPIAAARADEQFAIGSAFKLWVLDALAEDIAAGRLRWNEVLPLGPKSLPSGITQDWPAGAPVTVETLAILMISRSDNTATDTLIRLIGRDRIAARVRATGHSDPARMLPFPTTAEVFALKLGPAAARDSYAKAEGAGRIRMLAALDAQKTIATADISPLGGKPVAIDTIEWFASPADIARVFDSLRRRRDPRVLEILAISPSLPAETRDGFAYVGYKGGSETGVLTLAWLLRDKQDRWFAVIASWNDPENPVDENRFMSLSQRLIAQIR